MSMLIRFLRVLSCLAALAGSLTLVAEAKGAGPFAEASGHRWQRFNRDPAYESMTRAKTDVMLVLHQRKWPKEVIDYFSAAVWEEPGRRVRVVNGDRLDFMRTGPSGLWLDVPVDFREAPAKNMEFAAPATEWSYEYQGRTYENIPRSQLENSPQLFGYTVFGKVVSGMDVVNKIKVVPTGNAGMHQNVPTTPVVIQSATLVK